MTFSEIEEIVDNKIKEQVKETLIKINKADTESQKIDILSEAFYKAIYTQNTGYNIIL